MNEKENEMFRDVKISERLYSFEYGWGVVISINKGKFPLQLQFDHSIVSFAYTFDGKGTRMAKNQTLFWDEVKFDIPKKPMPDIDIDTRVLVWDEGDEGKKRMHFKGFTETGRVKCFSGGNTSWTSWDDEGVEWDYWELER